MKKIFTDNLPHKGKLINWKISVGYKVKFIYDDIQGEIEIIDYYKENKKSHISIKYNNIFGNIEVGNFLNCGLGKSLKLYKKKYINLYQYQVGEIITNVHSGKLKILKQIRMGKNNHKGYKYKCLICGNEDIIDEYNIKNNYRGCNVCSGRKVLVGYNDIWTTNPKLAKLLENPEDGYKYTEYSDKKLNWKCQRCGNVIENKKIGIVNRYGIACPKCSDGISYPEKIMYNILQQLDIDFIYQLTSKNFKWCNKYKYDFYFKINNEEYIIETHGLQHYENNSSFQAYGGHSLEDEQLNDKNKKELALKNNIEEKNYIVIDCRYSELEFIKNNIFNSRLNKIFDLSKIDWLECHKFACTSLVKNACDYWNNGIHSTKKISSIMKMSRGTITKYLKQGAKLNWCSYDSKEEIGKKFKKKVLCLNNKKIFNSITEAANFYNLKSSTGIGACCKDKNYYSGKDPITGEKLRWMYYNEYLKNEEVKFYG